MYENQHSNSLTEPTQFASQNTVRYAKLSELAKSNGFLKKQRNAHFSTQLFAQSEKFQKHNAKTTCATLHTKSQRANIQTYGAGIFFALFFYERSLLTSDDHSTNIFDVPSARAQSKMEVECICSGYLLVRPIGTCVHIWGSDLEQIVLSYRIYNSM